MVKKTYVYVVDGKLATIAIPAIERGAIDASVIARREQPAASRRA